MSWWSRLTGGKSPGETRPQRINYLNEALALERQGDYAAALTSYRLALRDKPDDYRVLQNMAIAYSRTGQLDEAVRCYRRALQVEPNLSGAHYGLAFLLIKKGDASEAREHLTLFLDRPPKGPESERWIKHARSTLESMDAGDAEPGAASDAQAESGGSQPDSGGSTGGPQGDAGNQHTSGRAPHGAATDADGSQPPPPPPPPSHGSGNDSSSHPDDL